MEEYNGELRRIKEVVKGSNASDLLFQNMKNGPSNDLRIVLLRECILEG